MTQPDPHPQERGVGGGDRLEVIKQGLKKSIHHDDWGGFFLTAEGEYGWPGSHVNWLIAEVERLQAQVAETQDRLDQSLSAGFRCEADRAHLRARVAQLEQVVEAFRKYHNDLEQKVTNYLNVVRSLSVLDDQHATSGSVEEQG
jgi:cell shape-determining protein MreC